MNVKSAIFSGIMTSLIVAMIALAVNHISERHQRRRIVVTGGAILGFALGCAFQGIKDQKDTRYEEESFNENE
ncbi:hypothetical protein ACN4EE_15320 [Geminocystis sp. CENA526]